MSQQSITDQHICDEMVTKIAKLARLRLTKAEALQYQKDFTGLLEMFHALDELNFDPEYQMERFVMEADDCRDDVIKEADISQVEKASAYFNTETSYFDVPQFIGNNNE